MNRRSMLAAIVGMCSIRSWAKHGWEGYDASRPLYLEGEVARLSWSDPHAYLELVPDLEAQVPSDLRERIVPRQQERADMATLLAKTVVPSVKKRLWRVELVSLATLSVWGVPRPKIKGRVAVIGYAGPPVGVTPTLRAEMLIIDDKAYSLHSDPARP